MDIGNTSTSLGLYDGARVTRSRRLSGNGLRAKDVERALRRCQGRARLDGVAISSVVPERNRLWERAVRRACSGRLLWVKHDLALHVKLAYPEPGSIGADRLANACAAVCRYGAPVIVADFGTALTFDVSRPPEPTWGAS